MFEFKKTGQQQKQRFRLRAWVGGIFALANSASGGLVAHIAHVHLEAVVAQSPGDAGAHGAQAHDTDDGMGHVGLVSCRNEKPPSRASRGRQRTCQHGLGQCAG